jgi:hypothetical protein
MTQTLTDFERINLLLERGDDATALLRAEIDQQEALAKGQPLKVSAFTATGLLTEEAFVQAYEREAQRCHKTGDSLAILRVVLDEIVEEEEELRLALQLRELAPNAGDLIGRVPGGYAVALPWVDATELGPIVRTFRAMVDHCLPNHRYVEIGAQSEIPQPPFRALPKPALQSVGRTAALPITRARR